MSALAAVEFHGAVTLGALADHEGVSAPSITKVITILEEKGLVQREADATDRRVTNVSTTAEGAALVAESKRRKTAWLTGRIRELSPEERQQLAAALDVLDALTQKDLIAQ